jgi:hypothetical protein
MAISPKYKFYHNNVYLASFKNVEDGYLLCTKYGEGSTVRLGHKRILYTYFSDHEFSYDEFVQFLAYEIGGSSSLSRISNQ